MDVETVIEAQLVRGFEISARGDAGVNQNPYEWEMDFTLIFSILIRIRMHARVVVDSTEQKRCVVAFRR